MRLLTYRHERHGGDPIAGVVQGDRVLSAGALLDTGAALDMIALLSRSPESLSDLGAAADRFAVAHQDTPTIPVDVAVPLWEAEVLAPVPSPPSIRDFYAFEQHVAGAYRLRGREVPAAWYEAPVFYFGHAGSVVGPDAPIAKPPQTEQLDFELEIACVIGVGGRDISAQDAWRHVAGMTILNDWSARDVQWREMSVGLGPAKGKDFATSLGPYIVTLDELSDRQVNDRHDLAMVARVNGEVVGEGNAATLHWTFPQMIARASQNVDLRPGDVIGSGTIGGGCLLELGESVHPWLEPGDEVELEIERLGRLRNRVI